MEIPVMSILDRQDLAAVHLKGPRAIVPTFLYLISQGEKLIKIGITTDLRNRLSGLQTSNPHKLELISWSLPMKAWRARVAERELHECFFEQRVTGEWFAIGGTTAVEMMSAIDGVQVDPASPCLPYDPETFWAQYDLDPPETV